RRDLERADDAAARDVRRLLARDVLALEQDRARGRREELGEEIEERGLARAVGPDQRMDGAAAHREAHVVDGNEALELLREAARFEDGFRGHCLLAGSFLGHGFQPPRDRGGSERACYRARRRPGKARRGALHQPPPRRRKTTAPWLPPRL